MNRLKVLSEILGEPEEKIKSDLTALAQKILGFSAKTSAEMFPKSSSKGLILLELAFQECYFETREEIDSRVA